MLLLPIFPPVMWTHAQRDFRHSAPWNLNLISTPMEYLPTPDNLQSYIYAFNKLGTGVGVIVYLLGEIRIIVFSSLLQLINLGHLTDTGM